MNYANIKYCDIANGSGIRTSLFVSGCTHHCKGCFNEEAWDFSYGNPFTTEVENQILESLKPAHIRGFTLLGGEPFEPDNQRGLLCFLQKMKKQYPDKNIWCFTGFTLDQDLIEGGRAFTEVTNPMLACIDVLVDGKFIQEKADITLRFRGSSNQRLLDVNAWMKQKQIVMI